MDAAPRNPLLVAIPPLILSAITAAILLYCKQIVQPGLDIGSALILLIAGSAALLFGLLALSFIIRMLIVVSFSESITSLLLIGLIVYAEILYANLLQHRADIIGGIKVEESQEPPPSHQVQAYVSGVEWARMRADETPESCEAEAKLYGANAAEFVRGCVLEIAIVIPKLVAFDSQNPNYLVFDQSITQKILPLLPEGVTLILAQHQDAGFKIALRASTKLEDPYNLAIQHIKESFANFKRIDFKSDGNVMEYYFYIEEKVVKPILPSKTSPDEMERKIRGILPKEVTFSFAIPSGAGFMVALESPPKVDVNALVSRLENANILDKVIVKSTTQINASEQELILLVTEKPIF